MARIAMLSVRFPRLNPENVRDEVWRELPLTETQHQRAIYETYNAMLRRQRIVRTDECCLRHVWMLFPLGPWVCENCLTERWTL